uniref:histone H1-like n=1 Tax=Maylandia zebra TaxID=106582 RepID=UPI000D2FC602|nr:histone H1-like [Maylandia zebra]
MMRSTCQRCGGKGSIINTPCTEVQAKKKKTMTSKPKKVSLSVGELIVKAVAASKERNGLSVAALKKALAAGGYDVDKNKARVKTAIKSLVAKGTLVQTKGTGASRSFKMNKATESKAKKPAAAKAKKPAAAAKKSPKKAAAALQTLAQSQPHQRRDRTKLKEKLPAIGLLKWQRTTE